MSSPAQVPGWVPEEQVQQMIDAAIAQYASSNPAPAASGITQEQIDAQIRAALDAQAETHSKQIESLIASLRGNVVTLIPEHSGGKGTEIAPTWSQYEQEQARKAAAAA
jgi:hypothetical protein